VNEPTSFKTLKNNHSQPSLPSLVALALPIEKLHYEKKNLNAHGSYYFIKTIVDHCRSTARLKLVNPVHLLLLLVSGVDGILL
jgi:hypothetical protein